MSYVDDSINQHISNQYGYESKYETNLILMNNNSRNNILFDIFQNISINYNKKLSS
jgi:hypothetical protein